MFLLDRFVVAFGHELLGRFVLNLLAKSFLDDRARRLAWPVTRNFGETREAIGDRVPFFGYFLRRQFNLQRRDGSRLLFDFNLHELTVTALSTRRKISRNLVGRDRRARRITFL